MVIRIRKVFSCFPETMEFPQRQLETFIFQSFFWWGWRGRLNHDIHVAPWYLSNFFGIFRHDMVPMESWLAYDGDPGSLMAYDIFPGMISYPIDSIHNQGQPDHCWIETHQQDLGNSRTLGDQLFDPLQVSFHLWFLEETTLKTIAKVQGFKTLQRVTSFPMQGMHGILYLTTFKINSRYSCR